LQRTFELTRGFSPAHALGGHERLEDGHEHDHLNRLEKSRACRTAAALPELLRQLKLAGYKVVHLVPKNQLTTLPKYDEMFEHRENLSSSAQPGHVAPAHHKGSVYMYAPAQGGSTHTHKKGTPTTGTTGAN